LITQRTDKDKTETVGVILLNLGGPDSIQAVKPFLFNLFSDRQIIQLGPPFLQKPLAWLIATIRSKKTKRYYSLIGGKSPILDITRAQAAALEEALNSSHVSRPSTLFFKVYVGMHYWHPFIEDVVPMIYKAGIRKLIALSLYPHYSVTTSGSSLSKFSEVVADFNMETFCISSWHNHPLYIEALVDVIRKGLELFFQETNPPLPPFTKGGNGGIIHPELRTPNSELNVHVLFSAHSLPKKIIDEGDPYVNQIMETIREITKQIPIKWHLSYQSKSGPVKWLEPSTDEKIRELAAVGIKNILVVPISFVSDHIETLYEVDILYKNLAEKLGITLKRVNSLNTHIHFIEALKDMIHRGVQEKGWDKFTALP
jgi:ferrochelatase